MFFLLQMLRLVFVMIGFFPFPFSCSHYLASFIIPPTIKWEDNDKDKKTKIKKITMATLSPHSCHTFHCVQTIKREDRVASWSFFWFWILHIPCQSSRSFDQSANTRSTVGVFKTQFCALSWTKTKLPAKENVDTGIDLNDNSNKDRWLLIIHRAFPISRLPAFTTHSD